jgi:hypothetical protein
MFGHFDKLMSIACIFLILCAISGCGKTESYYVIEKTPWESSVSKEIKPFNFSLQVSVFDRKLFRVVVFLRPYAKESLSGSVVNISCEDFAVVADGKVLQRANYICPTSDEYLQKNVTEALFNMPDGLPQKVVVTMPRITVRVPGSESDQILQKEVVVFIRKDWEHGFSSH